MSDLVGIDTFYSAVSLGRQSRIGGANIINEYKAGKNMDGRILCFIWNVSQRFKCKQNPPLPFTGPEVQGSKVNENGFILGLKITN